MNNKDTLQKEDSMLVLLLGIGSLFLNSIAYIITLFYTFRLFLYGINTIIKFNGWIILGLLILIALTASIWVYYSRPVMERSNPQYRSYFVISFLFNTIMGVSACFYIMSKLNLYEIILPSEEFILALYPVVTPIVFVLFFPMSIIFTALPAMFLVNLFVKIKYRQQIIEDPTVVNKYLKNLGGIIISLISIPIIIMMSQKEKIINFLIENTPYIVGSIPLYWVYLFIINPSIEILKRKLRH